MWYNPTAALPDLGAPCLVLGCVYYLYIPSAVIPRGLE